MIDCLNSQLSCFKTACATAKFYEELTVCNMQREQPDLSLQRTLFLNMFLYYGYCFEELMPHRNALYDGKDER